MKGKERKERKARTRASGAPKMEKAMEAKIILQIPPAKLHSPAVQFDHTSDFLHHECPTTSSGSLSQRSIFMFLMIHVFRASCLFLKMSFHTSHMP